jgi:spermidine synthase
VVQFATDTNYFTFIADAPSHVDLALGDARKRLEQERTRGEPLYDALIMDAYSGDAIPFHLATREAFHLYLDRLAPDGILAVHISNWHIDLAPLCKAVASAFNLQVTGIISPQDGLAVSAHWVFLTRTPVSFPADGTREINWAQVRGIALPSDERGSLLPLIRFGHTPPVKELVIDWSKVKLF